MRDQYEYIIVPMDDPAAQSMNGLGQQGWQLVHIIPAGGRPEYPQGAMVMMAKRPTPVYGIMVAFDDGDEDLLTDSDGFIFHTPYYGVALAQAEVYGRLTGARARVHKLSEWRKANG